MPKPKIAVLYFPGNNCEVETLEAVRVAGMDGKIVRWNTDENLGNYDGYIIPGGWSYEDRVRAGVIAAKDPVLHIIKEEARAGKPVLGICNGAQVLIETGMVPGLKERVQFALAPNKNPAVSGYYNVWVMVKNVQKKGRTAFTFFGRNEILHLPVAHGEGCFVTKEKGLIEQLKRKHQITFQYCDENGKIRNRFPENPNGSIENIAALSNEEGNVLAMMPHPERAIWQYQVPRMEKMDKKTSCIRIFESIKKYITNHARN